MNKSFRATEKSTGQKISFYFHYRDGIKNVQDKESDKSKFLTLGDSRKDWREKTEKLANALYEQTLINIGEILETETKLPKNTRRTETLVGHLALAICRRIARTGSQLESVRDEILTDSVEFPTESRFDFSIPQNSAESYKLLASEQMDELIDMLVLHSKFGTGSVIDVFCQSRKENDIARKARRPAHILYLVFQKIFSPFAARNSMVITQTYLGRFREAWLSISLGQAPSLFEISNFKQIGETNHSRKISFSSNDSLESTAQKILQVLMPASVLEEFTSTLKKAYALGYSKRPKLIFTSNNFDTDDIFKVYLSRHLEELAYVVGQHGNNYGVKPRTRPEERTCDHFLSWGWRSDGGKVTPVGVLKPRLKSGISKKNGNVLILRDNVKYDFQADYKKFEALYIENIIDFCEELNNLSVPLEIRPHSGTTDEEVERLRSKISSWPHITIQSGPIPFAREVKRKRNFIFGYDSTGLLELATIGRDFFLFEPEGLGSVSPEFIKNYEHLMAAGLLEVDPKKAARKVAIFLKKKNESANFYNEVISRFLEGIAFRRKNIVCYLRLLLSKIALEFKNTN